MDSLVLDNVTKSFSAVCAVADLTVRVPRGCVYGFLGPNGAGKTTTLRMIVNVLAPDAGRIDVVGCPSASDVRRRIGYMPEERGLYPRMTVRGMLRFIALIKGLSRSDAARATEHWLDRVELNDWADRKVGALSRGMHQRLQFAAAVVHDPDLLVLDEPFSGLDPVNLEQFKTLVFALRDAGKAVIFSTHVMEQAERLCDYILLIDKGRKVVDGTLEQIRKIESSNTIVAELEGETGFISDLPMVVSAVAAGRMLRITLVDGADPQQVLAAMIGRVRVMSFELGNNSLHELFLTLVGGGHA